MALILDSGVTFQASHPPESPDATDHHAKTSRPAVSQRHTWAAGGGHTCPGLTHGCFFGNPWPATGNAPSRESCPAHGHPNTRPEDSL